WVIAEAAAATNSRDATPGRMVTLRGVEDQQPATNASTYASMSKKSMKPSALASADLPRGQVSPSKQCVKASRSWKSTKPSSVKSAGQGTMEGTGRPTARPAGAPGRKRSTEASPAVGGVVAVNDMVYMVPQRMALALGFWSKVWVQAQP